MEGIACTNGVGHRDSRRRRPGLLARNKQPGPFCAFRHGNDLDPDVKAAANKDFPAVLSLQPFQVLVAELEHSAVCCQSPEALTVSARTANQARADVGIKASQDPACPLGHQRLDCGALRLRDKRNGAEGERPRVRRKFLREIRDAQARVCGLRHVELVVRTAVFAEIRERERCRILGADQQPFVKAVVGDESVNHLAEEVGGEAGQETDGKAHSPRGHSGVQRGAAHPGPEPLLTGRIVLRDQVNEGLARADNSHAGTRHNAKHSGWKAAGTGPHRPLAGRSGLRYTAAPVNSDLRRQEWERTLLERAILPQGFRWSSVQLGFSPRERPQSGQQLMQLSLITALQPAVLSWVATRNRICGVPVQILRDRDPDRPVRGVLINNRVANVAAPDGREAARSLQNDLAQLLGGEADDYVLLSTGVIGWSLPVDAMRAALPGLVAALHANPSLEVARGMMTTDRYPKLALRRLPDDGGTDGSGEEAHLLGIAKGAGMIRPNMGTMLCVLLSDGGLSRTQTDEALRRAVESSFNAVQVDGDESTSDAVLLLQSRIRAPGSQAFAEALADLCRELSEHIVRNGEGTAHVIRCTVSGMPDTASARGLARAVCSSALVRTAIYGNDPNVGRILAAAGSWLSRHQPRIPVAGMTASVFGRQVFSDGRLLMDAALEDELSALLRDAAQSEDGTGFPEHDREVPIHITMQAGSAEGCILASDLSHGYVAENADYRS